MKKILVPTDFSVQAENALKVAAQLAKKYQGEIYLLHMLELPMNMANPVGKTRSNDCLLYTSDSAADMKCVDLVGC